MDEIKKHIQTVLEKIKQVPSLQELENVRVSVLGKKGVLTEQMKTLGALSIEARKQKGQDLNQLKDHVVQVLDQQKIQFQAKELNQQLQSEKQDVTLPCAPVKTGSLHPVSQTMDELMTIFASQGFDVAEGPDVEDDFHNFTALNTPENHPARQLQDTFYLENTHLLRTHTSPVQIRSMIAKGVPIRIIAMGRVYRRDSDMTHTPMFHQIEGLVIDQKTHMGHLKGCLIDFMKAFFETDDVPVRFRPHFFPFTEPSAEMDIGCSRENGEFKICHNAGWMEVLGCGMVHPNVLKACGIDPEKYQGFAFGTGIDRLAMLKYGIPDLRTFFDTDLRWLRHYGFIPFDMPSIAGGLSS